MNRLENLVEITALLYLVGCPSTDNQETIPYSSEQQVHQIPTYVTPADIPPWQRTGIEVHQIPTGKITPEDIPPWRQYR